MELPLPPLLFDLTQLQVDFKSKKIGAFPFYTTLIKELARVQTLAQSEERYNLDYLLLSYSEIDSLPIDRFVNLTGESDRKECTLMLDTTTGKLYCPGWFNANHRTFATMDEYDQFASMQVIGGGNDWKICAGADFYSLPIHIREQWFDLQTKKNLWIQPMYYRTCYSSSDADQCFYITREAKFTPFDNLRQTTDALYYLGFKPKDLTYTGAENTLYPCDDGELARFYPDWKNVVVPSEGAYPFLSSDRFVEAGIWGEHFSTTQFIRFLVDNGFDMGSIPQKTNNLPYLFETGNYLLEALQKSTGIQLHHETITYPASFFTPISEITKHHDAIAYTDFLLWKIRHYTTTHATTLTHANRLYFQLVETKLIPPSLEPFWAYLIPQFDFSLQHVETKLMNFKKESLNYLETMENCTSIWEFSSAMPPLDFPLFGEMVTHLYNQQIEKIGRFDTEIAFLTDLHHCVITLFRDAHEWKTKHHETLRLMCSEEYVEEQFDPIREEWEKEILALESRYLPLVQEYFRGTLTQPELLAVLNAFKAYRDRITTFFLTERIPLIQKYHHNPKSPFLQQLVRDQALFKSTAIIVEPVTALLSTNTHYLTKKVLHTQIQSLFGTRFTILGELFSHTSFSEPLIRTFDLLQESNFDRLIEDVEAYGQALKKRNEEITALLFKMEKDLEHQK
jgi:hypothetical protein